jgi:hypothetical protein
MIAFRPVLVAVAVAGAATLASAEDKPIELSTSQKVRLGARALELHNAGIHSDEMTKALKAKLDDIKKSRRADDKDAVDEAKADEARTRGAYREEVAELGDIVHQKLEDGVEGEALAQAVHDAVEDQQTEHSRRRDGGKGERKSGSDGETRQPGSGRGGHGR